MKKRVLFINDGMVVGGIEKVLINILKYLDKEKFDIDLLLEYKGDEWEYKIPSYININYIFKTGREKRNKIRERLYIYFLRYMPGIIIQKYLIKYKYDVIVAFRKEVVCLTRGSKAKKIMWDHWDYLNNEESILELKNKKGKNIKAIINNSIIMSTYRKLDKIVCVNNYSTNLYRKLLDDNNKSICIYNLNDNKEIKRLANEPINMNINEKILTLCTVGRLTEEKGQLRLVKVFRRLHDLGYNFNLIIVGEGRDKEKIENYIDKNNLREKILLLGNQDNPYKYINSCDIYICPSFNESYGLSIAEAYILNKPVIATKCSGTIDLLNNGKYGILVENSEEGIFNGLLDIIRDKNLLNDYKEKSLIRGKDFEFDISLQKIQDLLGE